MLNVYFYLSYLPTYLTLRNVETMLPSLTHSLYAYWLSSIEEYFTLFSSWILSD